MIDIDSPMSGYPVTGPSFGSSGTYDLTTLIAFIENEIKDTIKAAEATEVKLQAAKDEAAKKELARQLEYLKRRLQDLTDKLNVVKAAVAKALADGTIWVRGVLQSSTGTVLDTEIYSDSNGTDMWNVTFNAAAPPPPPTSYPDCSIVAELWNQNPTNLPYPPPPSSPPPLPPLPMATATISGVTVNYQSGGGGGGGDPGGGSGGGMGGSP